MKVLISTSSFNLDTSEKLNALRKCGIEIVLNPYGRRLTESEIIELLDEDVVGMIAGVEPLTRRVLSAAKGLKVISRCGIGLDNVDLGAASELSIAVENTPGAPVVAVTELTVAIILDLLRKVTQSDHEIRQGKWNKLMGRLLAAQTIGIIGYGRIGKRVSQILRLFGSNVVVYDKQEVSLEADIEFLPFDEVLSRADVVSLHIPFEPETHHIIDREKLMLMKKGAFLVNTARGGLIDEKALYDVLSKGHLAGAGLDTFEKEPYIGPLASLPQVVLTAHMGSYAREAREQMEADAVNNLVRSLIRQRIVENI